MGQFVEVKIDSIRVSLTNQQRIVLLNEQGKKRFLPIWIGPYEAEAITIALQEIEVARPQTHDLLLQALEKLHARLSRVEVVALKGDVFYGKLVIEMNEKSYDVDARPSDSIALAVRGHVPILVAAEVMKEAGIEPDRDITNLVMDETPAVETAAAEAAEPEEARQRLSVFEDFLKNVATDVHPEKDEDSPTGDEPGGQNPPEPDET